MTTGGSGTSDSRRAAGGPMLAVRVAGGLLTVALAACALASCATGAVSEGDAGDAGGGGDVVSVDTSRNDARHDGSSGKGDTEVPDVAKDSGHDAPAETAPDAAPDAPAFCVIGGSSYPGGTVNPSDACQVCDPSKSTSAWSSAPDGKSCASGEVCSSGTCGPGCFISGTYYAASAPNPANPCQGCVPATSTTSWTSLATGTACGAGEVCNAGACQTGCYIGGMFYASGAANPSNACQSCQPATSTTAWSNVSDGTSCGSEICIGGVCGSGCVISGTTYTSGASNPANPCQSCQPATSSTSWTNSSDGTGCGAGEVCSGGTCGSGCFIGGTVYAPGTANPANSCQSCQPGTSTTVWSNVPDETSCPSGSCCTGTCVDEASDTSHCGGCGISCPGTPYGTADCTSGTCGIVCDPGYVPSGGLCVVPTCPETFPASSSTVGGPDYSGPLSGSTYEYQSGDYVSQAFACSNASVTKLTVNFQMIDRTVNGYGYYYYGYYYGCITGLVGTLFWDVYVNGTLVGSYSWLGGYGGTGGAIQTVSQTYTFPAIAAVGGDYTIEYVATSTVCSGGGNWDWISGGSATLQ